MIEQETKQLKRGLTICEAAAYCGISVSAYRGWQREGRVPGFWEGTKRIDRLELNAALDRLSGREKEPCAQFSKFDAWKAKQSAT